MFGELVFGTGVALTAVFVGPPLVSVWWRWGTYCADRWALSDEDRARRAADTAGTQRLLGIYEDQIAAGNARIAENHAKIAECRARDKADKARHEQRLKDAAAGKTPPLN